MSEPQEQQTERAWVIAEFPDCVHPSDWVGWHVDRVWAPPTIGPPEENEKLIPASEADSLRAENIRYREALRYIAGFDVAGYEPHMLSDEVARKALEQPVSNPGES